MRIALPSYLLAMTLCLSFPALASDPESRRAEMTVTSNSVSTPTYDGAGRLVGMETESYNSVGEFVGSTTWRHVYETKGRIIETSYVYADADDLIVQRMEGSYQYDLPGIIKQGKRTWYDGWDKVLRWQRETVRKGAEENIVTTQTDYYGAQDDLEKTRYDVTERDARGRVSVRDISEFDAGNVQLNRTYEQWKYVDGRLGTISRVTFDEADEILEKARVTHVYGMRNRLTEIHARTRDAEGNLTGTSLEERVYNGAGKMVERTIVYHNALGNPIRRLVESTTYDAAGHLKARRSSWETLQ